VIGCLRPVWRTTLPAGTSNPFGSFTRFVKNVAPGILEAFDDAARPLAGYNKLRLTARAVYK
jgi:hypothetical protein